MSSGNRRNYFYDTMAEAQPGDVVFSFARSRIQAIGVVKRKAQTAPKPDFGSAGSNWSDSGWLLAVEFEFLADPFRPKDFIEQLSPLLPTKYSPINRATGDGLQGVYLAEISQKMADMLILLSRSDLAQLLRDLDDPDADLEEQLAEEEIRMRQIEGDLEKIQIVKARRGQGVFRANVRLYEQECRVTHVDSMRHLRASHIKPWKDSDDAEKINGANGLLLAPHVDHLFDRGYLSFSGKGDVLVSPKLNPEILDRWSISLPMNVGSFKAEQLEFLEFHRDVVLKP